MCPEYPPFQPNDYGNVPSFSGHLYMIFLKIFAYWVIFHAFLSSAVFFFKITFFKKKNKKKNIRNTTRVSNRLGPDQARQNVGPDLGPNCLQRLSADQATLVGKELNETAICPWLHSRV